MDRKDIFDEPSSADSFSEFYANMKLYELCEKKQQAGEDMTAELAIALTGLFLLVGIGVALAVLL